MSNIAVGIDIGGTKIAIGLIDEQGQIVANSMLKTDLDVSPSEMLGRVSDEVHQLLEGKQIDWAQVKGVGVGAPGPLNTRTGQLLCPPNLKSWWDFPVVAELEKRLPKPVKMENDATAATLAEKWVGAAQDEEHFIFVTVSTGIGAGIYSHGRLITGSTGNAGDAGFMFLHPSGDIVNDEPNGYWEQLASGTAIGKEASKLLGREATSRDVFELAAQGDAAMKELIDRVTTYLGMGCVSLINLLDPQKIVIGGGVAQAGDFLLEQVRAYVSKHALNPSGRMTSIVPAQLRHEAGVVGAAALVHCSYE